MNFKIILVVVLGSMSGFACYADTNNDHPKVVFEQLMGKKLVQDWHRPHGMEKNRLEALLFIDIPFSDVPFYQKKKGVPHITQDLQSSDIEHPLMVYEEVLDRYVHVTPIINSYVSTALFRDALADLKGKMSHEEYLVYINSLHSRVQKEMVMVNDLGVALLKLRSEKDARHFNFYAYDTVAVGVGGFLSAAIGVAAMNKEPIIGTGKNVQIGQGLVAAAVAGWVIDSMYYGYKYFTQVPAYDEMRKFDKYAIRMFNATSRHQRVLTCISQELKAHLAQ